MIRVANFVLDEKFIDGQIEYHNMVTKNCHHDYYLVRDRYKPLRFIKRNAAVVKIIHPSEAVKIANKYDAVFLHSILGMPICQIHKIDKRVKVFWFAWGYDIYSGPYGKPLVKLKLFHQETEHYISCDIKGRVMKCVTKLYNVLKRRSPHYYYQAVSRVDYFSGVFPEEYEMVRSGNPFFNAKPVDYSYCPNPNFINDENTSVGTPNNDDNIIIGNSTAYENNHLDALTYLKRKNIGKRKVYMPLSYSPNPRYVNCLKKRGNELFGNRFFPLTEFIPLDNYNKILNSCGIAIFAIERQMAVGNIIACLSAGSKVFLFKNSILYKHFKDLGIKVFSIEDDLSKDDAFERLSDDVIVNNRRVLCKFYNKDVMLKKLDKIYSTISTDIDSQKCK